MICKICKSDQLIKIGNISHTANQNPIITTNFDDIRYFLFKCKRCGFCFKYPDILNHDVLLNCYKDAPENIQERVSNSYRRQYDIIRITAEKYSKIGRICDIGCANGSLLKKFSNYWDKYGIEPSKAAAQSAKKKNIKIIGETIESLKGYKGFFDVIMLIDVIEHLLNPLETLAYVRNMLKPGGIVLILTGNTDSWTWKLLGAQYWYCSIPEHISFFNKKCFDFISLQIGLKNIAFRRMSHVRSDFYEKSKQLIDNFLYIGERQLNKFGISMCRLKLVNREGPIWVSAKDHILCLMSRD